MTKGEFAEKSASFKIIDPDNGSMLRKSFARIGQQVKVMTKSTKERNDERMNSAFVLQCALFFVINWQRRY